MAIEDAKAESSENSLPRPERQANFGDVITENPSRTRTVTAELDNSKEFDRSQSTIADFSSRLRKQGVVPLDGISGERSLTAASGPAERNFAQIEDNKKAGEKTSSEKGASEIPKGFRSIESTDKKPGTDSYVDEKTGLRIDVTNASPEFRNKILKELANLPEEDRQRFKDFGGKIQIVGMNSNYFAANDAKERPRGHPPGSTWNNVSGAYDTDNKTAIVAERKLDQSGKEIPNPNPLAVLKHELGHGMNADLGNLHNTKEFEQAYKKDIAKLSPEDRKLLHYHLQNWDGKFTAGKEETAADVYAALRGHSALGKNPSENSRDFILKSFPETAKLLQERLRKK